MSIVKISSDDIENFQLITTPARSYSSSSAGAVGTVKVFNRISSIEKSTRPVFEKVSTSDLNNADLSAFEKSYEAITNAAKTKRAAKQSILNLISSSVDVKNINTDYFELVKGQSSKANKSLKVERITPTNSLTKYTIAKNNVKDMLMKYYKSNYSTAEWAYTNYNTLNFFSAQDEDLTLPNNSALLYPNITSSYINRIVRQPGYCSGAYSLTGAFTFDFRINPRYKFKSEAESKAGTLFHLSSSYALSIVTGSLKDERGYSAGYRLLLQLSHSADTSPSNCLPGNYPNDLSFLSNDNCLKWNNWHHVVVTWGTNLINDGTGSFYVDGVNAGDFIIPSGTINPKVFINSENPQVLSIGNFYEGNNSGNNKTSYFFSKNNASRDGVRVLVPDGPSSDYPLNYTFNHPLKAEVHNLIISRKYYEESDVNRNYGLSNTEVTDPAIAFYLPPFFVQETQPRVVDNDGKGGVIQSPVHSADSTTDDPFNVALAFGVDAHYINLENFTKDFAKKHDTITTKKLQFARLLNLSGSITSDDTLTVSANQYFYSDPNVLKRNLTILPNDDGNFDPNYKLLFSENYSNKFVNSANKVDYSLINLDNLLSTSSLNYKNVPADYMDEILGATPEDPFKQPGSLTTKQLKEVASEIASLTDDDDYNRGAAANTALIVFTRLQDPSSNQVTIFNISNLFYGRKIQPGTFTITDPSISGSLGEISITLKDDGEGNLYRADCLTAPNFQNSVGNIFYDEGIVIIKSPHLNFFGKDKFDMSFKGNKVIYSTKYEILANASLLNSSSNTSYGPAVQQGMIPSNLPDDSGKFIYISGIYLHDENMNVVGRVNLAQPAMKRVNDKLLFKIAIDY